LDIKGALLAGLIAALALGLALFRRADLGRQRRSRLPPCCVSAAATRSRSTPAYAIEDRNARRKDKPFENSF
jgi:hypothetical protein